MAEARVQDGVEHDLNGVVVYSSIKCREAYAISSAVSTAVVESQQQHFFWILSSKRSDILGILIIHYCSFALSSFLELCCSIRTLSLISLETAFGPLASLLIEFSLPT